MAEQRDDDTPRVPAIRKGQGDPKLSKDEFTKRFRARFYDPAFDELSAEIGRLAEVAWDGYTNARKSPRTRKAGPGFADPTYDLSIEWLEAHEAIKAAEKKQRDPATRRRVLLICGSSRNDTTCPGEMSKSYRLLRRACECLEALDVEVDVLDLSRLASEYGRRILPCKACVSTAMPLCHWPCSCYPNHSLGQVDDWMNELYPRFVAAHGVMIITPVYWYQAASPLKLLIDRLVCADGGNPDPTTTHGKKPEEAKAIEMRGWDYPRHLAGRAFAVVVHGDTDGVSSVRRSLADWLSDIGMIQAGHSAVIGRYIDYYGMYATSHEALDRDEALEQEVHNAARALATTVTWIREGRKEPDEHLEQPRQK